MTLDIIFCLLLFFAVIQLFFHVYYFLAIAFHKEVFDIKEHKPISLIICAHNELENLQKLIPLLLQQNYHLFEIIIINDRSNDGTYEYLEQLKKTDSKIKVVLADENRASMDYKKYALTLGIKAANFDYLLFTDADCVPANKNWILHMQSKFVDKTDFVLGISQYEKQKGLLNIIIRAETFFTAVQYISFALRKNPYMGIGRNLAYRKSVFLENKGFHPFMYIIGGDDDLFVNKAAKGKNTKVAISFETQTLSVPKTTWKEWILQKRRHLSVSRYYSKISMFALGLMNFSQIGFYLSVLLLAFNEQYFIFGLLIFLFRWLVLIFTYNSAIKKMRYNIAIWQVLFFDLFYPFYYVIVGLQSLRNRNIRWK